MAGRYIRAKFGSCFTCNKPFARGIDLITWSPRVKGKWMHVDCADPEGKAIENAPETWDTTNTTKIQHTLNEGIENGSLRVEDTPQIDNPLAKAMADAILPYIDTKIKASLDSDQVKQIVADAIEQAKIPTTITVEIRNQDKEVETIPMAHELLPKLLMLMGAKNRHGMHHNLYLYGAPGGSKSYSIAQCAKALGLRYANISLLPQTSDLRLIGYYDAKGEYVSTTFRDFYENGGVFVLEELDNTSPSLQTVLNVGLENGAMMFPDGMVNKSADCIVIGTGNTPGCGATPSFPERRAMDSAFRERFMFLHWTYDSSLEEAITLSILPTAKAWYNWVTAVRAYAATNYPRMIVSPRVNYSGVELLAMGETAENVAHATLFYSCDKDTQARILSAHPLPQIERS
jgi:hypothetical protein